MSKLTKLIISGIALFSILGCAESAVRTDELLTQEQTETVIAYFTATPVTSIETATATSKPTIIPTGTVASQNANLYKRVRGSRYVSNLMLFYNETENKCYTGTYYFDRYTIEQQILWVSGHATENMIWGIEDFRGWNDKESETVSLAQCLSALKDSRPNYPF